MNCEKTFYEINVTEAFRTVDADVVLWGEDLHDAKIVLYPKKITALPGYGEIKERLALGRKQSALDNQKNRYFYSKLGKYAFEYGLKLRVDEAGALTVKGKEDTWLIKAFDSGKLTLWHNNYVKTAPRERYITSGLSFASGGKWFWAELAEYIADRFMEEQ